MPPGKLLKKYSDLFPVTGLDPLEALGQRPSDFDNERSEIVEYIDRQIRRAHDTNRAWQASVRVAGCTMITDPQGRQRLIGDGSFVILVYLAKPGEPVGKQTFNVFQGGPPGLILG